MPRSTTARRGIAAVTTALALALGIAACAAEPTVDVDIPQAVEGALPDETQQQLQAAVEQAMTAAGASGAIVEVVAPWSGSWTAGLGTTTPGGAAVSTDMQFRVADLTRPMICDVLFALADEGTVALDDPVTKWVNGMPGYDDITLRQLCDSTSGIASYAPPLQSRWLDTPARAWHPKELVAYGLGTERTGTPGSAYRDSDTGYVLLGLALERASMQSAADLIEEYVTEPLALTDTELPTASFDLAASGTALTGLHSAPDAAGVMNCTAPADLTSLSSSAAYTAGGVVSNITDVTRYAQALAVGALPYDMTDRYVEPLAAYDGAPAWYTARGGALQVGSLIGQFGSIPGYTTAAFADPATGLTVSVVLNNSGGPAEIGAYLAWELAALASKAPAASGQTAPAAGLPWTAEQFAGEIGAIAICAPPAQ
jgi:D-alanyl-D-alanine carboxypeptidase